MNKTAIKNFVIWARKKLISDITYQAGMLGVTEKGIAKPLPQSTLDLQFYDIGTKNYAEVSGVQIRQREKLVAAIHAKERGSDYKTAFRYVMEEVAYTWFNRLIAVRFMEVNDYLPSHVRVLSSENAGKAEPDIVTNPFDTDLTFSEKETAEIYALKENGDEKSSNALFRMLFIKQCNKLHEILPRLFEETADYSELLLTISFTDKDGVLWHLVNDIPESDFDVSKEGQVEIIGWMYQYYNTEPKDEVFADLKKNIKISKEKIPAATQLFTPDWIVRYMVENSLGRLWVEGHPNDELKSGWKYYLEEAEQEPQVQEQLAAIRAEYKKLNPEDIKLIDPCMGSGHILVYAFDVLMQIYEACGYTQRDAAQSIVANNIYGLDIDDRAAQLAYFAVMMKARQYDRRFFTRSIVPNIFALQDSSVREESFYARLGTAKCIAQRLLYSFERAKELGSIITPDVTIEELEQLEVVLAQKNKMMCYSDLETQAIVLDQLETLLPMIQQARMLLLRYDVVITNPPYMSDPNMGKNLNEYIRMNYIECKTDMYAVFIKRSIELAKDLGYSAIVTMHSWMFLTTFEKLRRQLLDNHTLTSINHLGMEAFEGIIGKVVSTVAFVINKKYMSGYRNTAVRLTDYYDSRKHEKEQAFFYPKNRYSSKQVEYRLIDGWPIAYWIGKALYDAFGKGKRIGTLALPRQGLATGDNDKYLRTWFEIDHCDIGFGYVNVNAFHESRRKYAPYNKGGDFRKWYGNRELLIRFDKENYETLAKQGNHLPSRQLYFREGLTWSALTSGSFSGRYCEQGFVFDTKGSSCFFEEKADLPLYSAFLNSAVSNMILSIISPTLDFNCGSIAKLPVIEIKDEVIRKRVINLFWDCVEKARDDWDSFETSWDFAEHPFIRLSKGLWETTNIAATMHHFYGYKPEVSCPVELCYMLWQGECNERFNQLKANEEELNRIFIDIYGLQDELTPEVEDKDVTVRKADLGRDIRSLISYAVGCMFGRYSLNVPGLAYAGGDWDGSKYQTFLPDMDNCIPITDETYFEDDVVGRFVEFIRTVYGSATLEENLSFIAKALGNKGATSREVIRNYFLNDFMKDHLKTYQKRPIYWLFDSGKQNGFKALVYMHRWNADTVGNLRVEYLHRMQRVYEREIERMQDTIENSKVSREVAAAQKRKEKLTKQLKETKDYDAKIAHIALSRIDIDLDDGVKVNYEKVQKGADGKSLEILAKIK